MNTRALWIYPGRVSRQITRILNHSNGRCRDECLSVSWFMDREDARQKIEAWRWEYKEERPHYSLSYLTLMEFIKNSKLGREFLLLSGPQLTVHMQS